MSRALGGRIASAPSLVVDGGIVYRDCPPWVPKAVRAVVEGGYVPMPTEIVWHPKPLKSLLGRCWPSEGRIHVHPWSGTHARVEEQLDVDVSGEIRTASSRVVTAQGQDDTDLVDTLAHELAHLVHARHGPSHRALTARLVTALRAARSP